MPVAVRLLLALIIALVIAAPASAQDYSGWGDDDPDAGWSDDPVDDPSPEWGEQWLPPSTTTPATTTTPPTTAYPGSSSDPGSAIDPSYEDTPLLPVLPTVKSKTVPGKVAKLRADGTAAVPRSAPLRVRTLIRAANEIVGKPYLWGGGHARLVDKGYDCSGAVSYALIKSGLLYSPLVSGALAKWATAGAGRYVSVYANKGHVYMEVAGLRLDTSAAGDPSGASGVRWRPLIGRRQGFHARHPLGL